MQFIEATAPSGNVYRVAEPKFGKWGTHVAVNFYWDNPDFGVIPFTCIDPAWVEPEEPLHMHELWALVNAGAFGPIAELPE